MTIDIHKNSLRGKDGARYLQHSYLVGIDDVMIFMRKAIYENELYSTRFINGFGNESTTTSSLGKHLRCLNTYGQIYSSIYKFSPLLEFFFEEYRRHPIMGYLSPIGGDGHQARDSFDDFVASMRKNALACKLKKRVRDWESKPKKNAKRLVEFDEVLFKRHGRLMVVRLDLNYHKATITSRQEFDQLSEEAARQQERDQDDLLDGQEIGIQKPIEGRIALEEVQADRKRLFANMKGKPSLFKHLVGYVWVIEWTRTAGFHLHVAFFFDGSEVRKHQHYAQEIGCYWRDVITQGRGYFENCNLEKNSYGDRWALGEIDYWDTPKRDNLRYALQYFCKTNQMVQVMPYAGCHLFGCGFIHRQRKIGSGRPRAKEAF